MNILTVLNASKRYGAVQALAGASFSLRKGELLALLGPNGAGKTTLIRAIAGRVRLDGGEIRVFDQPVVAGRTPRELGIVPQELAIYPLLTARENLDSFGRLHGLSGAELAKQVDWALERTGLSDRAREPVKQFSGGMRRRLNIACGILHHPRIVLAAGVEGGLSAAGLPLGHHHVETSPLENVGNGETDPRIEMIDQARRQQLHGTRPRRVRSAHADQLNS